jgi:hypothetical protein
VAVGVGGLVEDVDGDLDGEVDGDWLGDEVCDGPAVGVGVADA